jgi:hypothetical protein
MLHKKPLGGKKVQVTFTMPALPEVESLSVCAEFNAWNPNPMARGADGGWSAVVILDEGKSYRYRFRDERGKWHNDWHADWYIPNDFGTEDSVVDLSTGAGMPQASHSPRQSAPHKQSSRQSRGGDHRGGQPRGGEPGNQAGGVGPRPGGGEPRPGGGPRRRGGHGGSGAPGSSKKQPRGGQPNGGQPGGGPSQGSRPAGRGGRRKRK